MFLFKWGMTQGKEVNLEPQNVEVYGSVSSSIIKNKWWSPHLDLNAEGILSTAWNYPSDANQEGGTTPATVGTRNRDHLLYSLWVSLSVEDCNIHVLFMHVWWAIFPRNCKWWRLELYCTDAWTSSKWFCKCTQCTTWSLLEFCLSSKCISCCSVVSSIAIAAKLEVNLYRRGRWFYYKTSRFYLITLPYWHIHKHFKLFRSLQWIGTFMSPSFLTSVSH